LFNDVLGIVRSVDAFRKQKENEDERKGRCAQHSDWYDKAQWQSTGVRLIGYSSVVVVYDATSKRDVL